MAGEADTRKTGANKSHRGASTSVPREHGFWVMMGVALLDSIGRSHWDRLALIVAAGSGLAAVLLGARLHGAIRKSPRGQLMSSAALGLLVLPGQLAAGLPWRLAIWDVAGWASLFVGCSLAVRATFARGRRGDTRAPGLSLASVALPSIIAVGLWTQESGAAIIAVIGALGMLTIGVWRPRPRQLKAVGLAMATIALFALAAHLVYPSWSGRWRALGLVEEHPRTRQRDHSNGIDDVQNAAPLPIRAVA